MENSYLTKKTGLKKQDIAENAEHQLFVKHFNKSEERFNNYMLLFGGEKIIKPYK